MLYRVFFVLCFLGSSALVQSQTAELPLGYKQYYYNAGNNSTFLKSLSYSEQATWTVSANKYYTHISTKQPDSVAQPVLPVSRGFIADNNFGEYIMEFEFRIAQPSNSDSSGFYLLSTAKSCDTYYAICFTADSAFFYYVQNGESKKISSQAFNTLINKWQKIRVERDMLSRTISISSMHTKQSVKFTNSRLVMGYVGFGAQDVNSHLRNIRIWAPTAISESKLYCE